jgi:hypothetical protein
MTLVTSGQAASFCEAKDACEAALVQALAALDIRRRPSLPCSYQWRENPRELCSDSGSWIQATIAIERVCKKRGAGVVRVTCVLAMEPGRHHPLKLARLSGLDGPLPRDRLRKRSSAATSRCLRNARDTLGQPSPHENPSRRQVVLMRSHQQKTSFHTLGTRLGPETSLASPAFLCSAKKWLRFSVPANLTPSTARKRRSMIALDRIPEYGRTTENLGRGRDCEAPDPS